MIVSLMGCVTFPFRATSARVGSVYTTLSLLVLIFPPVRGSKNCLAVGSLCVQFSADLILQFLTVSLVEAQVLPTDDANCKVTL